MKTTKSISKRLLTVLLVLTLVLSFAVPSMASTITIEPGENTATPNVAPADRFHAYQIFKGSIDENMYNEDTTHDENTGYENPNPNKLSNVEWGSGVKAADEEEIQALLGAFMSDDTPLNKAGITADDLKDSWYAGLLTKYNEALDNDANYTEGDKEKGLTEAGEEAVAKALEEAYAELTLGDLFAARVNASMYRDGEAYAEGLTLAAWKQSASLIAQVLTDFTDNDNNAALAEAFAKIIAEKDENGDYMYLVDEKLDLENDKESGYLESNWNAPTSEGEKGNWTINTDVADHSDDDEDNITPAYPGDGYYLIVDQYHGENENGESNSDYLVGVFGESTIKVKTGTTTSDKNIIDSEGNRVKGDDYNVGDEITFELSATLPENYGNYDSYYLEFIDEMSKGLTYLGGGTINGIKDGVNSLKSVYVKVYGEGGMFGPDEAGGEKYDVYEIFVDNSNNIDPKEAGHGYIPKVTTNEDGSTSISVKFADLKNLWGAKATGKDENGEYTFEAGNRDPFGRPTAKVVPVPLNGGDEIYVEYTATLNDKSVVETGVPNSSKVKYSNDPKWDGDGEDGPKGTTPESIVYVYDFGIDIDKTDASNNEPLKDAGFAVTKTVTEGEGEDAVDVTYYALLTKDAEGKYWIAGWVSEADYAKIKDTVKNTWTGDGEQGDEPNNKFDITMAVTGKQIWDADVTLVGGELFDFDGEYYLVGMTDENGKLHIDGLDSGEYVLKEEVVPDGYDKAKDITVKFEATYFDDEDITEEGGTETHALGRLKDLYITYTVNGQEVGPITVAEDGYWYEENPDYGQEPAEGKNVTDKYIPTEKTTEEKLTDGIHAALDARLNVPNFPEGWLPGTGGMGTTLFYVAGGVLLAGAALYLIFANVKKRMAQGN